MVARDRTVDRPFVVAGHRRRTLLVAQLTRTGPDRPATALWDRSESFATGDPDPVWDVLVHCHRPKLADAGGHPLES